MVNRSNSGRDGFPELRLNATVSPDVYSPNHTADVPAGTYRAIVGAADAVARTLGQMAKDAAIIEGRDQALADVAAGQARPRSEYGFRGASYNETARIALGGKLKSAILESLQEAELAAGDSVAAYDEKIRAVRAGYKPTGFVQLDTELAGFFDLQTAAARGRVRDAAHKSLVAEGRAGFMADLNAQAQLLDQIAAGATFDAEGSGQIAAAVTQFANALGKYGPKSAFTIGGVTFEADDGRLGVMTPEEIGRAFIGATAQARQTWVLSTARQLGDAEAQKAFADEVRKRWADKDPAFAGLDGVDIERLAGEVENIGRRTHADQQARRAELERVAREKLDAFRWGGSSEQEILDAALASGDEGLIAQARTYAEAGRYAPGVLNEVAARASGYVGDARGAIDFVIDALEGGEVLVVDDNGAPSKWGIRANQPGGLRDGKPVSELTRDDARRIMKREYWDAIDADSLPPAMAFVAFQAMVNTGNAKMVRRWIHESGGQIAPFLAKQTAFYEELARKNPGKYADDLAGWRARIRKVAGAAAALEGGANADEAWESFGGDRGPRGLAREWTKEAFRSDPIGYAATKNLASVAPLDVDAMFQGDAQRQAAFGQALRERASIAAALSKTYAVPTRFLAKSEAAALRDAIAQDPRAAIVIAQHATAALGGDGAQMLLRELGRDRPGVEVHIADLATTSPGFASTAAEGLALKAQGAKLPNQGEVRAEERFEKVQAEYAPAFAFAPQVLVAARQVAEAAMIADAAKGIQRQPRYYMASAIGAAVRDGRLYGGVAKVNGAPTITPRWLAQDRAEDALEVLGRHWADTGQGPVYSNGQPMSGRDIGRLQLVMRPNGAYWLRNPKTGAFVRGPDGKPFEHDFDQSKRLLAERLPGAVQLGIR